MNTFETDVDLLHALVTNRTGWADPAQVNDNNSHVGLRYDTSTDAKVYVQFEPFAVQAYDADENMADFGYDEVLDLADGNRREILQDDLREFVADRRWD